MTKSCSPVIIIPARLASTRLPGKPLADIHGAPMIVHVWRRAVEADIGPVVVACAEQDIAQAVTAVGGHAILTDPDHPSGSDRIYEALSAFDPASRYDVIVNLQGDLPTIEPAVIRAALRPLDDESIDIATLITPITEMSEINDSNVVKAVVAIPEGADTGPAVYFSRNPAPWGDGPYYHHIGLYAYRRAALGRFVRLPPGLLETRERLEQLRAIENGMRIGAALVNTVPFGVDAPADLERARALLAPHASTEGVTCKP